MKTTLMICALACLLATPAVLADTVSITSNTSFASPSGQSLTSTSSIGFVGPQTITFTVAGKTCNLNGSARGPVPTGCNYSLTVAPNGSITGVTSGNEVCTPSSQIASSCK